MTILLRWKLGEAPISNLMELLEDKGIRIHEIETDDNFIGISAWAEDIPVIAVRCQDDLLRKRFTISHELGHILLNIHEKMIRGLVRSSVTFLPGLSYCWKK